MSRDFIPTPDRFEGIADEWRYGSCYAMAIALSQRLGWPIACLVVDLHEFSGNRPHVVHAWVRGPDGEALDGGGFREEANIPADYLAETNRKWSDQRIVEFADGDGMLAAMDAWLKLEPEWPPFRGRLSEKVERALQAADGHLVGPAPDLAPGL